MKFQDKTKIKEIKMLVENKETLLKKIIDFQANMRVESTSNETDIKLIELLNLDIKKHIFK